MKVPGKRMIKLVRQDHQPTPVVELTITSPVERYVDVASLPPIAVVVLLRVCPVHSPIIIDDYRIGSNRLQEPLLRVDVFLEINPRLYPGVDQAIDLLPLL